MVPCGPATTLTPSIVAVLSGLIVAGSGKAGDVEKPLPIQEKRPPSKNAKEGRPCPSGNFDLRSSDSGVKVRHSPGRRVHRVWLPR